MTRRHDLDWVRVFAFCLLVIYHVGMYYVTWDWHVNSPYAGAMIEPLMVLSSPWRLSVLFLISGVATAFLVDKQRQGFLRARSWRLLLPLLFGMLVIVPPQSYYEVVEKLPGGYHDGYLAFWGRYLTADPNFCRGNDCLKLPAWNHLWFVAYLWIYTMLLGLALRFLPTFSQRLMQGIGSALGGVGLLIWPVLWLVAARLVLFPIFNSTHGLFDDWYNHAQYFAVFLIGFAIAKSGSTWAVIEASRRVAGGSAIACGGFLSWYVSTHSGDHPAPTAVLQVQRVIWAVMAWSVIIAILGYARHIAPGDSPALRYLSAAIFPVYILHQTVIVVLAHNLKPSGLAPAVEGPILVVATFALCLLGYEIIRRFALLRLLFGLKSMRRPVVDVHAAQHKTERGD